MPVQTEFDLVAAALRKAAPECEGEIDRMTPEMEIASLGLDSIKQLEAAAHLEEAVGASFPDDRLAKVVTVEDLLQLVREHAPGSISASSEL